MGDKISGMHKWMCEARPELKNWEELARKPLFEQIYKGYTSQKLPRGIITARRRIYGGTSEFYSVDGQIVQILEYQERISRKPNPMITVIGNAAVETDPELPRDTRNYLENVMKQDFQEYVRGINLEAMIEAVRKDLSENEHDLTYSVLNHYFP